MKNLFRILFISLLFSLVMLLFNSCDVYKKSSKEKTDIDFNEKIETKTFRKGDTVVYVPNVKYKDTIIYTYNRQGTTLKTVYDKSGSVQKIDCYSADIETLINETRRLQDNSKIKDSEKKEEVNTTWILYLFGAFMIIICFALFLFFIYIKGQTATFTSILEKISK